MTFWASSHDTITIHIAKNPLIRSEKYKPDMSQIIMKNQDYMSHFPSWQLINTGVLARKKHLPTQYYMVKICDVSKQNTAKMYVLIKQSVPFITDDDFMIYLLNYYK